MLKRDINKMRMYDQVVHIISEHGAAWQANVPFTEAYTTFSEKLNGLKAYLESQHVLKGTHSILKKEAQEALIKEALRIERVITFYAAKTKKSVLLNDVNHNVSFWKRLTEVNRLAQSEQLRAVLAENLADLSDFGLVQADLDGLDVRILTYKEALSEPRSAIVQRVHVTEGIDVKIRELDELLRLQLDTFVRSLAISQPDFVSLFLHAREVIHYKGKSSSSEQSGESDTNESDAENGEI